MVKIAIISDTHLFNSVTHPKQVEALKKILKGYDYIFHAGDIVTKEIYDELASITKFFACKGNSDDMGLSFLPAEANMVIEGKRIVMVHNINKLSMSGKVADIVIHGHTHVPSIKEIPNSEGKAQLQINPGSLFCPRSPPQTRFGFDAPVAKPTFAILDISDDLRSYH